MAITTIDTLLTSLRTTMTALSELAKDHYISVEFYADKKYLNSISFHTGPKYTAKIKITTTKEYS